MSSEKLGSAKELLKGNLGGSWDILEGSEGNYTDLGVARRFGGASAAYSLRDIGAMNGRVVRVRRDVDGQGSDPEEDFSANQVSSGALEDWVNGKLESTLPADVATAAAAYSLRKVKASYSGDAIRIRRSSDDAEVNVAFDSDSKVSLSSSISTVSGSTTATDLNGFLNNEHTIDFQSSSFSRVRFTRTDDQTIGGQIADKFEVNATGSNYYLYNNSFFDTNASGTSLGTSQSKQVLTFKYYVDSTESPNVNYFHFRTGAAGNPVTFNEGAIHEIVKDSWQTLTLTLDAGDSVGLRYYVFISNTSASSNASTMTVGEAFYLQDIPITYSEVTAFVHTWYDQAGSNNAVQETAGDQPKIAENGALLDGIKFDAATDGTSPDFLQVNTRLGVTTDHFVSAVFNGYQTDSTAFGAFLNTRNGNAGFQYGIAAADTVQAFYYAGAGNNANSSSDFVLSNNSAKRLVTFDKDGDTLTGFGNATTNGISISNAVNTPSTTVTNIGVGGNVGTTTDLGLRANINELIVYETDQADNRFKIESNINNYYGLYNDEYEWDDATNTEWQNNVTNGTTTFTANGKDGFTITATGANVSNFKYAITSPSTASNDYYKVSFNVNDPDGLFDDAQLRLTATGAGATSQTVTNGFNSLSLRTGASFEYMTINSDGGGSSKTATLSDFKISRIARNGFVETWYDQSANLRDAIQETATNQPSIVQNGGIVKVNSKPAITFDANDNFLEVDGSGSAVAYSFSPSGDFGMFIVSKQSSGNVIDSRDAGGDGIFLQQSSSAITRFRYNGDGSIDIVATNDAQHFNTMTLDGTTLSASVDGGTAGTDTVTAGVSTTQNLVLGAGFNDSNFTDGEMQEAIFYENNKTTDKSNIEADIDNFYSIT